MPPFFLGIAAARQQRHTVEDDRACLSVALTQLPSGSGYPWYRTDQFPDGNRLANQNFPRGVLGCSLRGKQRGRQKEG